MKSEKFKVEPPGMTQASLNKEKNTIQKSFQVSLNKEKNIFQKSLATVNNDRF